MFRKFSPSRATRDLAVSSTLALAVSLAAGSTIARAQSFLATPTVIVPGSATVSTGSISTTVTLNSQRAVINWSPNDTATGGGPINFQTPGTTATFVNNPNNIIDFAVLNNILPTDPSRMVQFNGTVISQLQTLAGASSIGGTVYFYSPGGILVSPTAVINVGNLGLSASPIAYNAITGAFGATGSVINNGAQTVAFGQANAGSSVQILSGAQINANSSDGSYVAVVAPRINNTGTINVNGNAALVAADAATITFNPSGLYSISLDVGTSATGTALFNGGTITGSASTGAAAHQIYLVTAPKNTLINMLIGQGSNIGFDVAGAANVSGNSIILSGGYDVLGGAVNSSLAPKGGVGGSVNTNVTSSNVTSALTVISSNNAQVDGSNGGTTTLASDTSVFGYKTAFLGAFASSTLNANGRITVQAIDPGFSAAPGTSQVTGGTAQIFAQGGTVALHGAFNIVDAQATGATSQVSGVAAGNGTGGNAQVSASSGGSITADGSLFVSANGQGGSSRTNGVGGGNGKGGNALVQATGGNSSVILKSNVGVGAQGQGGTGLCLAVCTAEAGTGTGGTAQVSVSAGGSITAQNPNATNFFNANADGYGGGAVNTNAATGAGGNVFVTVQSGSTLNLASAFSGTALGVGGVEDGSLLTGGAGTGGNVQANVQVGGTLTASGLFKLVAVGTGGAGDPDSAGTGSSGGAARGGFAGIASNGGNATFNGAVQLTADGNGGFSGAPGTTGAGGAGTGGSAQVNANISGTTAGTIALRGTTNLSAIGRGGSGIPGGLGTGGSASVNVSAGSSVVADGIFIAAANGQGGSSMMTGTVGGSGKGGTATAQANGANSSITFKSNANFAADGYGGTGNCLTACTTEAGTGTGGTAQAFVGTGGSLTTLDPNGTNVFELSASGYGGGAFHTNAGDGTGGSAFVTVQTGSALTFGSAVNVFAEGRGGSQAGTLLIGGAGTGGSANTNLQGGTLTANRTFSVSSQGYGGVADADTSGTGSSGGAGFGGGACDATGTTCIAGGAFISSNGGNGTFNMGVNVDAGGFGGAAFSPGTTGAGGAGTGGFAQIRNGSNSLNTNNATLTFNGPDSVVSAVGMGGRGYPGGVGTGGSAIVQTFYGTIQGTGLIVDSSGTGGNGSLNGKGGDGFGGFSSIQARNNPNGTATITLNSASLFGIGNGGRGGDSINVSLAGGAGGVGSGGSASATANAGDGKLTITGALNSFAGAVGGAGGNGANDAVLTGGNGGAGGAAIGTGPNANGSQNGTTSGALGTTNAGSARFGSVAISVAAQGGAGGTGGNVSITGGPQGNGGAGGGATGGFGGLLVRGSTVTVTGNTQLSGDAFGGNGGQGAVVGNGGNALVGGSGGTGGGVIFVTATNRFQVPTQRGTLIAGPITGSVAAVGGTGGTAGTSTVGDSPINFTVINSDVTASSLGLFASAASVAPNALPSVVQLSGGTVNLGTAFQFNSAGPITVGLDTATLTAGFVGLSGSDWILPTTPPVLAGTINATTGASFSSANNIVTYANVNFSYPVSFNVIGNFRLGNITTPGDFASFSGGTTTFGSLSATNVDIQAGGPIIVGPVTTPGYVSLDNTVGSNSAAGIGDITVAAITAGRDLGVYSNGSVFAAGLIQTGAGVFIDALGSVHISDVSAGLVNPSTVSGDTYEIAVRSGGSLTAGNLASRTDIGLVSAQTISAGTLTGQDMLLLGRGNLAFGAINSRARVLIADASMAQLGGTFGGQFDKNAVFAGAPVQSAGSISVNSVAASQFTAASQQSFTSGTLATNAGPLLIDSGAAIQTGNLATPNNAILHALGTITTGTINASTLLVLGGGTMSTQAINARGAAIFADASTYALGVTSGAYNVNAVVAGTPPNNIKAFRSAGAININGNLNAAFIRAATAQGFTSGAIIAPSGIITSAGGPVVTGNLLIGNGFTLQSDTDVTAGDIDVGLTLATTDPMPSGFATLNAGGKITAGNIRTRAGLLLIAGGTATIGSIDTKDVLGLIHGASSYGPITATGRVLLADQAMAALGVTTTAPFFYDINLVFNAATVSSAGPITINGAVSAASMTTDSLGAFTSGAITTANFVDITTGGNALVSGAIQSGQETSILAQGGITVGNVTAGASGGTSDPVPFSIGLVANGGPVVAGNLRGTQSIGIGSSGSIATGTLSGANLLVGGGSTITTGAISMSGKALLASYAMIALGGTPGGNTPYDATLVFAATPIAAPGAITINGTVNSGGFFHAATLQGFTSGAITAGTDISLSAGGAAQAGALGAGGPISINANSLALGGGISTAGSLTISTVQSLTAQNLTIGGNIALSSQNALTTGNVTSSNGSVSLTAGSALTAGAISAATTAALRSVGAMQTGSISAGSQVTISADSFVLNSPATPGTIVTTGGGLSISTVKALVLPSLTINGNIVADSRTALTTGDVVSNTGSVALSSGGSLTSGSIKAATSLALTAPGTITAGNTNTFAGLTANGNITISGGDVTVLAGNTTTSNAVLTITGTGALNLDTAFGTTSVSLNAGTNLRTTGSSASGTVTEVAGGAIDTGSINAGGIAITAGTTFQSGNLISSKGLSITTGGNLNTANLTANGGSAAVRSGGTLSAGVINTTNGILLNSTGAATVQGLTSSGAIQFNTASTFTSTGNVVSANQVIGSAAGNLTLANVTASGGVVELVSSQGNLTTGRISAATDVAAIAGGSLGLGQVSGRDIVMLAGSDVQVGNVSAGVVRGFDGGAISGATGRVLIANSSIGSAGGVFGNYNFNAVFNSTGGAVISNNPPRIGGTVNAVGTINAGAFSSYSQGAMTGQVINAFRSLEVESGGLVTVALRWTSPDLTILSNDIAIQPAQVLQTITTTAGLSSGTTGIVTLASLNPNGAFIGDGLTAGQGYALSNAEVGLVQSGSLTIAATAAPNLATTMTIGTLSLTGSQAGNTQDGTVQFATGNPQTLIPSGTIRVTGAVTAKGFATANQLQFDTGTFELDASAGSLSVTDSSNAMTGGISISADRIHIAAASILDKLRADPLYAGRITELNTPPAQPQSGPVLSASKLFFAPIQTLYIQNTGTAAVQAGFLVPLAGLTIETPSRDSVQPGQTASPVSIVINGQFVGTSSTNGTGQGAGSPASITGATAFMQFVQQTKLTGITADSQFNGCLISAGTCGMTTAPAPDLSTQIQVLQTPTLPSAPAIVAAVQQVSSEVTADPQQQEQTADKPTDAEQKEEKEAKASAKAPIAPPAPMIDTRPLSPPVSVDEPVAGGGNPALFGIGVAPTQIEGGDK